MQYDFATKMLAPLPVKHATGEVNDVLSFNKKFYVASQDSGLIILNNAGYKINIEVSIDNIQKATSLLRDAEDNISVASANSIYRLPNASVKKIYTLSANDAKAVHSLYYSAGNLWLNNEKGIQQLSQNGEQWVTKNFPLQSVDGSDITSMYKDASGLIWIGSLGNGITLFDPVSISQKPLSYPPLKNSNIISISGKANGIWVSALEGVFHAEAHKNQYQFTSLSDTAGVGQRYVYDIYTDKVNRTWFATDGRGISLLENNSFKSLSDNKAYKGKVVYKIREDFSGNIWYATYDAGLVKYDHHTFQAFTQQQGLSSNEVLNMAIANNKLVVLHKKNIDVIDASTGVVSYVNLSGLDLDINTDLNSCTADEWGNVYFISNGAIYKYEAPLGQLKHPRVIIDNVQLYLHDIDENQHTFKHDENNLTFFYTGLYYTQPEKISYQYMLQGYDEDWVNTNDRVKTFSSLPPGKYTFKIRASLNNSFEHAEESGFSFVVKQPFWLNPFVIGGAVVFFLLSFYFIFKLREKNIQRINQLEKERMLSKLETLRSQIDPHFLFNSFNTLISEIETHPENAVTYVEYLSDFYRSIVTYRDKDLISLKEELQLLHNYIFLQKQRYKSGFGVNIDIDKNLETAFAVVPMGLQLLIENAIKHNVIDSNNPLVVNISVTRDNYLVVQNEIKLKSKMVKPTGFGLQNIQKRYALLSSRPVNITVIENRFIVGLPLIKIE